MSDEPPPREGTPAAAPVNAKPRADGPGSAETRAASDEDLGPFSEEHPPPLDFDAWCGLATELLQRDTEERFEILAERDLDPLLWERCDQYWSLALATEIAAGGSPRVDVYADRCAAEMATRREAAAQETGSSPSEGASASAAASPPARADAAADSGAGGVDETAWLMQAPIGTALPFVESGETAAPDEVVKATDLRLDLAGQTALATPAVEDRDATLPFAPAIGAPATQPDAATPAPGTPHAATPPTATESPQQQQALERYAALCAKLAAYPADAAQIRTSYGLASDEQLAGLHARWQQRFRAEPGLRQRWESLQQQHLRQLAERRAPR